METTLNHPQRFKVYRRVTRKGQKVRDWFPLRQGIVDLRRRLQLSRTANARYLDALAVVGDSRPSHHILDPVSQSLKEPQPYRALRPISPEDSRWFAVLLRGEFQLQGVRNSDLRQDLIPEAESDPARRQQASARVTRQLRLLRAHGLIYRVGRTYYYRPTQKGYDVMSTALEVPPDRSGSIGSLKSLPKNKKLRPCNAEPCFSKTLRQFVDPEFKNRRV